MQRLVPTLRSMGLRTKRPRPRTLSPGSAESPEVGSASELGMPAPEEPLNLQCPITFLLFRDPVVVASRTTALRGLRLDQLQG